MVDDRIVFFTDPARAPELIQKHGGAWVTDPIDVARPSFWCDVAQALHFLSAGGFDDGADVLSAVNVLLDLVRATGAKMDDRRKKALYAIADYCTFNKDLTKYLEGTERHGAGREALDDFLRGLDVFQGDRRSALLQFHQSAQGASRSSRLGP